MSINLTCFKVPEQERLKIGLSSPDNPIFVYSSYALCSYLRFRTEDGMNSILVSCLFYWIKLLAWKKIVFFLSVFSCDLRYFYLVAYIEVTRQGDIQNSYKAWIVQTCFIQFSFDCIRQFTSLNVVIVGDATVIHIYLYSCTYTLNFLIA